MDHSTLTVLVGALGAAGGALFKWLTSRGQSEEKLTLGARQEIFEENQKLRDEFRSEIAGFRREVSELRSENSALRNEISQLRTENGILKHYERRCTELESLNDVLNQALGIFRTRLIVAGLPTDIEEAAE